MPLRSVEAATRDDAIAAARKQFGPTARVVGVRKVRSGGVLGFFATERYVAEVAADAADRPTAPAPVRGRAADAGHEDDAPSDFSSPLASAAPARARATAPARNGAAAWAAEAARTARDVPSPASYPAPDRAASDLRPTPPSRAAAPAGTGSQRLVPPADQERVSELAGLLAAHATPESPAQDRARQPRAPLSRASSARTPRRTRGAGDDDLGAAGTGVDSPGPANSDAPSPFSAALARMVAGDRDVRQAVREALDDPAAPRSGRDRGSWPDRPGANGPVDTPEASRAPRQKEETVGDQVIAPSSYVDPPVEVPAWAARPEVPAPPTSPREEAVAEVLRAALAQGHSDEAISGILRKVLAGVSPQTALAEPGRALPVRDAVDAVQPVPVPAPVVGPVAAEPTPVAAVVSATPPVAVPPAVDVAPAAPAVEAVAPSSSPALFPAPPVQAPVPAAPVSLFTAPNAPFPVGPPFALPPLFAPSADSMWGDPSPATLWGEPVTVAYSRPRPVDAPIWAEIPREEPAATADPVEGSVTTTDGDGAVVDAADAAVELPDAAVLHPGTEPVANEAAADRDAAAEAAEVEAAAAAAVEAVAVATTAAEAEIAVDAVEAVEAVEAAIDIAAGAEAAVAADAVESDITEADITEPDITEAEDAQEAEHAAVRVPAETATEAESAAGSEIAELVPAMARTASDPAPMMSLDATTVMPPLSLLPPLPSSRGRGRPPVPPASRQRSPRASAPAAGTAPSPEPSLQDPDPAAPLARSWATVTRLPVALQMETPEDARIPGAAKAPEDAQTAEDAQTLEDAQISGAAETREDAETAAEDAETPEDAETLKDAETPETRGTAEMSGRDVGEPVARADGGEQGLLPGAVSQEASLCVAAGDPQDQLEALGLPRHLLGDTFADDVAAQGLYAALTRALGRRLPSPPQIPSGAGEVLFVVGPGVESLRAARSLAASLRLDRDSVQWATRGELAGLAPKASRVTTVETAMDRRQDAASSGTVTIVAVDAPLRCDAYWMSQMLAVWAPAAVWVVVEATRKPEDLEPWIDGLPRVDALVVTDTDLSADPAAVLRRVAAPVAVVDGVRATPHRWASLLCERLESTTA